MKPHRMLEKMRHTALLAGPDPVPGGTLSPLSWETGPKDTVIALPGETTRLRAHFDIPGRYVSHCHIIDHEDNEMMRPFQVA